MLFLRLGDIRRASFIPRDPKSFAVAEQNLAEASQAVAVAQILHGPESTTLQPGKTRRTGELPLLANVSLASWHLRNPTIKRSCFSFLAHCKVRGFYQHLMARSGLDSMETQGNWCCRRVHTAKWFRSHLWEPTMREGPNPSCDQSLPQGAGSMLPQTCVVLCRQGDRVVSR